MKSVAASLKIIDPTDKLIVGCCFEKIGSEIISNFIDPIKISDEESRLLKAEIMFDSTILNDYLTALISRRMRILIAGLYNNHLEYKLETKVNGSKIIQTRYYQ